MARWNTRSTCAGSSGASFSGTATEYSASSSPKTTVAASTGRRDQRNARRTALTAGDTEGDRTVWPSGLGLPGRDARSPAERPGTLDGHDPAWTGRRPKSSTSASSCPSTTRRDTCGRRSTASGRRWTRSEFSYEIIVIDDGSNDGSGEALREHRGHPAHPVPHQPGLGLGPQVRHPGRAGPRRRVDRRRHDLSERPDPRAGPRSSRATTRSSAPAPSEQGTHKVFRVPAKWFIRKLASYLAADADPRPQLGPAGLPARRRAAVREPAAPRLLVRHHASR